MGYEVEPNVVGPFEVLEAADTGGAAGGILDRGIVARTQDGRSVVIGEVWAAGVGRGSPKIRIDASAVARSIVHRCNMHETLLLELRCVRAVIASVSGLERQLPQIDAVIAKAEEGAS